MRITAGLEQNAEYEAFWRHLATIGELGPREAELVADTGRQGIHENFKREQSPDGVPWAELAPMTQRERRKGVDHRGRPFRAGAAHPILRRTDDLLESFTNPRHPRNVTAVTTASGETRIVLSATDDPQTPNRIANLHAGGLTETGRVIPPRPFIGLSTRAQQHLLAQTVALLAQRVKRL